MDYHPWGCKELEAADLTSAENTDNNCWNLTFRVKDGYEGVVKLQAQREDEEWKDTGYSVTLAIAPPLAGVETPAAEEIPAAGDPEEILAADSAEESGEIPEDGDRLQAEDLQEIPGENLTGSADASKTFALSTEVSFLLRFWAAWNAI